jgi:hypothetical protein
MAWVGFAPVDAEVGNEVVLAAREASTDRVQVHHEVHALEGSPSLLDSADIERLLGWQLYLPWAELPERGE